MPEYHFTGTSPRVLTGLSQGVNALLLPADRPAPPYGSTVEAEPGDSLETDEPYDHPELELAAPDSPLPLSDASQAGIQVLRDAAAAADPEPVVPIALVAAEPIADPAPADMTAEGAPAPAEPTN